MRALRHPGGGGGRRRKGILSVSLRRWRWGEARQVSTPPASGEVMGTGALGALPPAGWTPLPPPPTFSFPSVHRNRKGSFGNPGHADLGQFHPRDASPIAAAEGGQCSLCTAGDLGGGARPAYPGLTSGKTAPTPNELIGHLEAEGGRNRGGARSPRGRGFPAHKPRLLPRERRARGQCSPGLHSGLQVQRPPFHRPVPSFLPSFRPPRLPAGGERVASARSPTGRALTRARTHRRAPPGACAQTPTPRAGRVCGRRRAAGAERRGGACGSPRSDLVAEPGPAGPPGLPPAVWTPNGDFCGAHGSRTLTPSG